MNVINEKAKQLLVEKLQEWKDLPEVAEQLESFGFLTADYLADSVESMIVAMSMINKTPKKVD